MHRPCPCNESLLTHLPVSLLLAALGTAAARKVACGLLHENDTALSTLNLYWRVGVDVHDFRIVENLPMHPLCFLGKLRCRFPHTLQLSFKKNLISYSMNRIPQSGMSVTSIYPEIHNNAINILAMTTTQIVAYHFCLLSHSPPIGLNRCYHRYKQAALSNCAVAFPSVNSCLVCIVP